MDPPHLEKEGSRLKIPIYPSPSQEKQQVSVLVAFLKLRWKKGHAILNKNNDVKDVSIEGTLRL